MLKLYYGSNINNILWQVSIDNISSNLYFWPKESSCIEIAEKLCQLSLFDTHHSCDTINVINISNWKFNTNNTKNIINDLCQSQQNIIFILENKICSTSIFDQLKIKLILVKWVNQLDKNKLIHLLLVKNQIYLSDECEKLLDHYLPYDVKYIKNEIAKLSLFNKKNITINDINNIIFFEPEDDIFSIVNYWLNNDKNRTILVLNNLLKNKYKINDIIPIIVYTLLQLKFYCEAIQENWTKEKIHDKLNISFWLQNKFAFLDKSNKNLTKIDNMLNSLYNFDISMKLEKIIPYPQFIRLILN